MQIDEKLWQFVDGTGSWLSRAYGIGPMTGRVLGWLLVCDPPEQTAAQLAEALDASRASISGATRMLIGLHLIERRHVRGERADRFRLRPGVWDDQVRDQGTAEARALLAVGLDALADAPPGRRARLEELDAFYAWWQARSEQLSHEWQDYKRTTLAGRDAA
jgi:DNA-binding transcriptional ArsR family regulator